MDGLDQQSNPVRAVSLAHREMQGGEWWRDRIPAWSEVRDEDFASYRWQLRNSVATAAALETFLDGLVSESAKANLLQGLVVAPMQVRLTPYLLSLIDWDRVERDPIRRQFLPMASEVEPDHPMCTLDSLDEQRDAAAPGLTHRYPDKVLLLALDVCPVYCRFCTRSYAVGADTDEVEKLSFGASRNRWDEAVDYIRRTPQIEDIVVSGGDLWLLSPRKLEELCDALMSIDHVRRIRLASKGLAVMPQKVLDHTKWMDALARVAETGVKRGVEVALHTHANHPRELTEHTERAMRLLRQLPIVVRNQAVLQAGVNDDAHTMRTLVRRLGWMGIQPYYVYTHDMVPGVEVLRTPLSTAVELEKDIRGSTAGFNTPTFVCDSYGGGGKRSVHSMEHYDRELGIAVYRSPVVDPDKPFYYFDPLRSLSPKVQRAWQDERTRARMIAHVVERAGMAGWN